MKHGSCLRKGTLMQRSIMMMMDDIGPFRGDEYDLRYYDDEEVLIRYFHSLCSPQRAY